MRNAHRHLLAASLALGGCSSTSSSNNPPPPPPGWQPGQVFTTPRAPNARGFLDRRGLIHAHSIYSHDACDGEPKDTNGVYNQTCLADFRRGLCQSGHDFVFLTDHRDSFTDTEFPDAILHQPSAGDVLVMHGSTASANRMACPDGHAPLIMAGSEAGTMPVGLRQHVSTDRSERSRAYGSRDALDTQLHRDNGAVVMLAHPEDFTQDQLAALPIDGFEMFNVHANALINAGTILTMLTDLANNDPDLPHPDLVFVPIITEDTRYTTRWGNVLSRGLRRVTTMGSDCHRNSFPQMLADGERIDSYRRAMNAFSNHLLVRPNVDGLVTDDELKDALRAGRLYGAFELLGYPVGFDVVATTSAGDVLEMGSQTTVAAGVTLRVTMPTLQDLDASVEPPVLTARILRATAEGWDVLASGEDDLAFSVTTPGVYRAEIRLVPRHLRALLGYDRAALSQKDMVWIYANPFFVD